MAEKAVTEVYRRTDGKWAWHAVASNNRIVASDGGQGYENRGDAEAMMERVLGGAFATERPTVEHLAQMVAANLVEAADDIGLTVVDAAADITLDVRVLAQLSLPVAERLARQLWGVPA